MESLHKGGKEKKVLIYIHIGEEKQKSINLGGREGALSH